MDYRLLGHGGQGNELVPRLFEALVGKKVIGAAAGGQHTAVWTEGGEQLFTFGNGANRQLGHGGQQHEGNSMSGYRGWLRRWWGRMWLVHRQVISTWQCGPMQEKSLHLGCKLWS